MHATGSIQRAGGPPACMVSSSRSLPSAPHRFCVAFVAMQPGADEAQRSEIAALLGALTAVRRRTLEAIVRLFAEVRFCDWARPRPHLHRDWAHPSPHLHRDWAHPTRVRCGTDRLADASLTIELQSSITWPPE